MTSLHITNGDSAAGLIRESGLGDEVLPWRDPMHHGPFPANLGLDDLSALRARYLAGPDAKAADGFRQRDAMLRSAKQFDEVILWFEHDLLDQLQILQVLDWISASDFGSTNLTLICIDRFPGLEGFRGLGQLNPSQIAGLFDQRRSVTQSQLSLAKSVWAAFRASDPQELLTLLEQQDLSDLPFLKPALLRHLEEYPSAKTGLSRTERQILTLVAQGVQGPVELFTRNMDLETVLFVGDWHSFTVIEALCQASLIHCRPEAFWHLPRGQGELKRFREQRLSLTEHGRAVLSGKETAFSSVDRDRWLGGVQLRSDKGLWTWDAEKPGFVLR